jgi:uncharacterized protein
MSDGDSATGWAAHLVPTNGQVIATSETYEREQSVLNGIESLMRNALGARVDDETGE